MTYSTLLLEELKTCFNTQEKWFEPSDGRIYWVRFNHVTCSVCLSVCWRLLLSSLIGTLMMPPAVTYISHQYLPGPTHKMIVFITYNNMYLCMFFIICPIVWLQQLHTCYSNPPRKTCSSKCYQVLLSKCVLSSQRLNWSTKDGVIPSHWQLENPPHSTPVCLSFQLFSYHLLIIINALLSNRRGHRWADGDGRYSQGLSPTHNAGAAQRQKERTRYFRRTSPRRRRLAAHKRASARRHAKLHATALFPSIGEREKTLFKAILLYINSSPLGVALLRLSKIIINHGWGETGRWGGEISFYYFYIVKVVKRSKKRRTDLHVKQFVFN